MFTMWKGKKRLIIIGLLAVAVIAGSIGAVAYAADPTPTTPTTAKITILDRVATILKLDPKVVKDAFAQAQKEQQDQALTDRLNQAVKDGRMTQQQADQYKQWWQARPTTPAPGFGPFGGPKGRMGGMMRGGMWGPAPAK